MYWKTHGEEFCLVHALQLQGVQKNVPSSVRLTKEGAFFLVHSVHVFAISLFREKIARIMARSVEKNYRIGMGLNG